MQALSPQKRPDEASDHGARADDIFVNILSLLTIPVAIAWQTGAVAQAQLSGHLKCVREFLYPRPHTVNITGQRKFYDYKKASLLAAC